MEQWDILDKNGLPTGRTVSRKRIRLSRGEYHLVVHIWIIDSNGRLLIQRRSDNKPLMPGEWAATGGSAVAGEDSCHAASRELFEELGIAVSPEDMNLTARIVRKNSFLDMYIIHSDVDAASLHLQKTEVAEAKWVTVGEFKDMLASGNYHNYGKEYFGILFKALGREIPQ